jgi:hypothetical protein
MGAIIKCIGLAGQVIAVTEDREPDGMYLASFDVEAFEGRGTSAWTEERSEAMIFMDAPSAWDMWRQQSKVMPFREDGKPNRPLTAFSVEVESMTDHETFDLMFDGIIAMKRKAVKEGTMDVPFVLHYATMDWLITAWLPNREPLETAMAELLVHHGPPLWLVFCADTWFKEYHDEKPGVLEHGILEKAFMEGDFTVKEQLIMMAMGKDHELYSRSIEYVLTDDGDVEFNEPKERPTDTGGQLVNVMHRIISLNELESRAALFAFLEELLTQEMDDNV